MSEQFNIWWIDDEPDREEQAEEILEERNDKIQVEFESPEDIEEMQTEPDLALVDWKLDSEDYFGKGLSMEAKIREIHSETPVYGFSGDPSEVQDKSLTNERFDQGIFPLKALSDPDFTDRLVKDIQDYKSLSRAKGGGLDALFNCLEIPESDKKRVKSIIPREFSDGLKEDSTGEKGPLQFSKWVVGRFLDTPGPLLNKTWVATTIGIRPKVFDNYWSEISKSATRKNLEYSGVFSHQVDTLIWESQLIETIVEILSESEEHEMAQETHQMGIELLEPDEDDLSCCRVCGESFPETVAAAVEGESAEHPTHYHCSDVHHSREGSFKDYRVSNDI